VYNGDRWNIIADRGDTIDGSQYSVSRNPSTELYYRLHILKVGGSDVKKHKCEAGVNGAIQQFYIELNLLGRCIN
jgi:hypothetical protein